MCKCDPRIDYKGGVHAGPTGTTPTNRKSAPSLLRDIFCDAMKEEERDERGT